MGTGGRMRGRSFERLHTVTYPLPSDRDWAYLLDHVMPRLGMWIGRESYERAVCFVQGFDLARGEHVHARLQEWAQDRYGETNIGWPWVILRLAVGTSSDVLEGRDLGPLTAEEDEAALSLLRRALRDVVATE